MNTCPLVSVLLASYRSGDFLFQAVDSELMQDYPHIELLVCDDGSEDFDMVAMKKRYENAKYPVRIFHQERNVGTVKNLNYGLTRAKGEYVLLFAADDVLASENVISQLVEAAMTEDSAWVLGKTMVCDESLVPSGNLLPTELECGQIHNALYENLCFHCFLPASGSLYERSLLNHIGGLDETYRLVEDWPLLLKLAREGHVPKIVDTVAILRRSGGVSNKNAAKNQVYQRDLVGVMEHEILAHLEVFSAETQKRVQRHCADKRAIYALRFEITGFFSKIAWCFQNVGVLLRKVVGHKEQK